MSGEPRFEVEALRPNGVVFRRAVVSRGGASLSLDIVAECNRLRGEIRANQGWTPQFRIISHTDQGSTDLTHLYADQVN